MVELGQPPMPWQQHVLDVALEVEPFEVCDDQGVLIRTEWRFFYREVRLWVPRQSGKTSLLLGLMLHRCLTWDDQRVLYQAQTRAKAKEKLIDEHLEILKLSRFKKFFWPPRLATGSEQLKFRKTDARPSTWGIDATTEKSSHGPTTDLVIADEFFAQVDNRIESGARPTMITRDFAQIWFVSTFGDEKEGAPMGGPLLVKVDDSRQRCRRYDAGNLKAHAKICSFEWSAADVDRPEAFGLKKDEVVDYGDVEMWRRTMPGLECNGGIISEAAMLAEFDTPDLAPFKRAYLNLRPAKNQAVRVIPFDKWVGAVDAKSRVDPKAVVGFTFDVSPDSEEASITFAGPRADGKWHSEVIANGPGVGWVVPRMVEAIVAADADCQFGAVGYIAGTPAAALVPDLIAALAKAKVAMGEGKTSKLIKLTTHDYAAACVAFLTAVMDGQLKHLDQAWLNAAVDGAKKLTVGNSWVWDRKKWSIDITALCSATAAMRVQQMAPAKKKKPVFAA